MQEGQPASRRGSCLAVTLLIGVVAFFWIGYLAASPQQKSFVTNVWVATLTLIAAAVVAVFWGAARYVWIRVRNLEHIYPDENGDLPLIKTGQYFTNPNLIPYHTYKVTRDGRVEARDQEDAYVYQAWMFYLAMRGKGKGSPPAAAFSQPQLPEPRPDPDEMELLVTRPGQSRLIDAVVEEL